MRKPKHIRPIYYYFFYVLFRELLTWNIVTTIFILLFNLYNGANGSFTDSTDIKLVSLFFNSGPVYWAINIVAILIWIFEHFIFAKIIKDKGVFRAILLRVVIYIFSFFLMAALFTFFYTQITRQFESSSLSKNFIGLISSHVFILTFVIGMFINGMINYNRAVTRFIGLRNVGSALLGVYKVPKEEQRMFLFMDLVSSTYVAEKLGHKKYSLFLQDCYNSLSDILIKYRATVYQYVGDEILLTWKGNNPKNFMHAVDLFFEVKYVIRKNADEYLKNYNLIPEFNASLNYGKVMVAEVGQIKSEFAYHGDVLNTGARIQKMCKKYKQPLVASFSFVENFRANNEYYQVKYLDEPTLTGKMESVRIYAINPPIDAAKEMMVKTS